MGHSWTALWYIYTPAAGLLCPPEVCLASILHPYSSNPSWAYEIECITQSYDAVFSVALSTG
jgi:hypothetical protein